MQKITPHLWFDKNAEEAVNFYTSVFKNSKVLETSRYTEAGQEIHGMTPGTVMSQEFELDGYRMLAINGGPVFKITPAISFFVNCSTPEEVDEYWNKLSEGGTAMMPLGEYPFSKKYGWTSDKFGLSWQIMLRDEPVTDRIVPSLLFVGDKYGKAEEAVKTYTSLFENSSIDTISHYGEGMEPNKPGTVMYAGFTLFGQKFSAMDGGGEHAFTFNEAVSLLVTCKDQEEIDKYWNALSAVPESEQCGWLKDKFGVSWQIVPEGMGKMLTDPDKEKVMRVTDAFMKMHKLDMQKLNDAFEGK
jgi:predicted 3-demethylubiquinone-9 3-methyltransferase (glyoxalase superfamily)